jgi:hypothetical protein
MKRLILALLIFCCTCGSVDAAIRVSNPNGTHVEVASLAAAAALSWGGDKTVIVDSAVSLSGNLTWPSDRLLDIRPGGIITTTGYTLTFTTPPRAGLYQIFAGTGTVLFSSGSSVDVYPQWWGAIAGDTSFDQTAAFNKAINSVPAGYPVHVVVPPGDYRVNLVLSHRGLVMDFPADTIGRNNVRYSQLRPWSISSPVVTLGDDTALSTMTLRGLSINSETANGSGSHAAIGLKVTGGAYEVRLDDFNVSGAFTDHFVDMNAGATVQTSKIFFNGFNLVEGAGSDPTSTINMYDATGGSYLTAIYINNFTINGVNTTHPILVLDSAALTLTTGYFDLFGTNGIMMEDTARMPKLIMVNTAIDLVSAGVALTNNTTNTLNDIISSVNSTFSSNATIDDKGTSVTIGDANLIANAQLQYPIVSGAIYFALSGTYPAAPEQRIFKSGNSLYLANDYASALQQIKMANDGAVEITGTGAAAGTIRQREIAAADALVGTIFVDSADHKLKFKDSGGTVNLLY